MSSTLGFNFYGVKVSVEGSSAEAIDALRADFEFFQTQKPEAPGIVITLAVEQSLPPRNKLRLFRTRMGTAYYVRRGRFCDYGDGTSIRSHFDEAGARHFNIRAATESALHEAAYSVLLSSVGEALDGKGLHRVHALGVDSDRGGVLVILPQGGGKSALATLMNPDSKRKIYSDEIPLLQDGKIHPFPMRMALRPQVARALGLELENARRFVRRQFPEKLLFPIPKSKVAPPAPLGTILIGRKIEGNQPRLKRRGRLHAFFALMDSLAVGRGVPQMAEHMLRLDARLFRIFLSRVAESWRASRAPRIYAFEVVHDARANARELEKFLGGHL